MTFALYFVFFFFNDTATTEIYTLSLHDALPISSWCTPPTEGCCGRTTLRSPVTISATTRDRKSTRLNSSHLVISYAVFCLKKKKRPISLKPTFRLCTVGTVRYARLSGACPLRAL